jgi:hypothetical protein
MCCECRYQERCVSMCSVSQVCTSAYMALSGHNQCSLRIKGICCTRSTTIWTQSTLCGCISACHGYIQCLRNFRMYLWHVFVSPYSQFITTMNIAGSIQISKKPNSSLESSQLEPLISGWPELVENGSVQWPVEDDNAVSDTLIIHFNFD